MSLQLRLIKILVAFFILLTFSYGNCLAAYEQLLEAAKCHEIIASPSETFLYEDGGKAYLISIGVSEIESQLKEHLLNARKSAKLSSQAGLTKFIHDIELSSREILISERSTLSVIKDNKKTILDKKDKSHYENIISEKSQGALRNVIEVGTWKRHDKKEYYYVLAVEY